MKIILSNYRYHITGGPERYLFAIKQILEQNGHEVVPFSMRASKNFPSEYSDYFISAIGSESHTYFEDYDHNIFTMSKIVERQFYSPEAFIKARRLSRNVNADIAYSLHFLNKMSPSILDGFKSTGLPVVVRISDFGLICPQGHLFHEGKICEACLSKGFFQAVKHRCIKNSLFGSMVKAAAWRLHRLLRCFDRVDAWVFPSQFTRNKFIEAGMEAGRLHWIPTFIDTTSIEPEFDKQEFLLFFGRIIEEKGLHVLLDAYSMVEGDKPRLLIIGNRDDSPYSRDLVSRYGGQVEFLDFMPKERLSEYIKRAMAVIIPSIWYDNLPNVLLEAYAHGKPVVAPNFGSFGRVVVNKTTGLLFDPFNQQDLVEKLLWAINNTSALKEMGRVARAFVIENHSPQAHYESLISLFTSLTNSYKGL